MADDSKLMGAVAYFLGAITGVILYFVKSEDKYVKYHAVQSILLTIAVWIVMIVLGAVFGLLTVANPLLGAGLGLALFGLIQLDFLLLWLYCMWKAYSGEKFKLPVIGDIAAKHAG